MSFMPRRRIRSRWALTLSRDDLVRERLTVEDFLPDVRSNLVFVLCCCSDLRVISGALVTCNLVCSGHARNGRRLGRKLGDDLRPMIAARHTIFALSSGRPPAAIAVI